jgi:hypothetical protein
MLAPVISSSAPAPFFEHVPEDRLERSAIGARDVGEPIAEPVAAGRAEDLVDEFVAIHDLASCIDLNDPQGQCFGQPAQELFAGAQLFDRVHALGHIDHLTANEAPRRIVEHIAVLDLEPDISTVPVDVGDAARAGALPRFHDRRKVAGKTQLERGWHTGDRLTGFERHLRRQGDAQTRFLRRREARGRVGRQQPIDGRIDGLGVESFGRPDRFGAFEPRSRLQASLDRTVAWFAWFAVCWSSKIFEPNAAR